jgi:hypothetical protein
MHVTHKTAKPLRDLQAARDAVAPLRDLVQKHNYLTFWENSTKTPHVREILVLVYSMSPEDRVKFYAQVKSHFANLPAGSWAVYKYNGQHRAKVFYTS